MLTEAEKKWLEERTWPVWDYFSCRTCKAMHQFTMRCIFGRCPLMTGDYKDAAEFEARVVEKLAKSPCWNCPEKSKLSCPRGKSEANGRPKAEACRLKHARLAVEAEMEENNE